MQQTVFARWDLGDVDVYPDEIKSIYQEEIENYPDRNFPENFYEELDKDISDLTDKELHNIITNLYSGRNFAIRREYPETLDIYFYNIKCRASNYITSYEFCSWDAMEGFLDNPTKEYLESCYDNYEAVNVINYYYNTGSYNMVRSVLMNDPEFYIFSTIKENATLGALYWYPKRILECTNIYNLQNVLSSYGIDEKVIDSCFITYKYLPEILMIQTENSFYFLKNPFSKSDTELYNVDNLKDSFEYQKCDYIIDGEVHTDSVLVFNGYCFWKVRDVLEKLTGNNVIWNQEEKSIGFFLGDDYVKYCIEPYYYMGGTYMVNGKIRNSDNRSSIDFFTNYYEIYDGWTAANIVMINGTAYFDYNFKWFLRGMNKSYEVKEKDDEIVFEIIDRE